MKTGFKAWITVVFVLASLSTTAQQQQFSSLDELLVHATSKSVTLQSNDIKIIQAKQAKLAAILSIPDVQANINGTFTNNTKLAVSLFPAETFGGSPGTYREIRTGIPYNTNFSQSIDIKLLNLEAWQSLKMASVNMRMNLLGLQQSKKALEDNIASIYYNIIQLQAQLKITEKFIANADTVLQIVANRHKEGNETQQKVNDAKINWLNQNNNKSQIEYLIKQYYISLKLACDIPEQEQFVLTETILSSGKTLESQALQTNLNVGYLALQENYARLNLKKARAGFSPTLSLVASNAYNLYNSEFKMFSGNWINNNYVGLKLSYTLPTYAMIKNKNTAKYDYLLALKSREQSQIHASLETLQLGNDLLKVKSQLENYKNIGTIQEDSYQKNRNLYNEKLIPLDDLITSFNNLVTAQYNLIAGESAYQLAKSKIIINNKFSINE